MSTPRYVKADTDKNINKLKLWPNVKFTKPQLILIYFVEHYVTAIQGVVKPYPTVFNPCR